MLHLLLRQTFGSDVQIETYQVVNDQQDYWALIVQLQRPRLKVLIKLAGPKAAHFYSFDRTAVLNRLIRQQTSIPMPEIVAIDTSYTQWPWRYLIQTYVPGEEWADVLPKLDAHERTDAYGQIGRAIAELHRISFSEFGVFAEDGTVQAESSLVDALTTRIQRHITSSRLTEMALSVIESHAALLRLTRATLCHEDLHRHNILFHYINGRWQLATILDFDKAWAGHHEIDLARMDLWHGQTGDGFWPAYQAIIPLDPDYPQRRPVYQFIWCLEFAVNTPAHLQDTQRLCEMLGLPPITSFP
jgi:aminoglycoside phosphotransferase (APT) family kinase protein